MCFFVDVNVNVKIQFNWIFYTINIVKIHLTNCKMYSACVNPKVRKRW